MKIYIAARFDDRDRMRFQRERLGRLGHTVVSSWLDEAVRPDGIPNEAFLRDVAVTDIAEVSTAECFILDTQYPVGERGGRENEWGLVMANPYVLKLIVGPYRTVFHRLAAERFDTWDDLIEAFPVNTADSVTACLEKANYGKGK